MRDRVMLTKQTISGSVCIPVQPWNRNWDWNPLRKAQVSRKFNESLALIHWGRCTELYGEMEDQVEAYTRPKSKMKQSIPTCLIAWKPWTREFREVRGKKQKAKMKIITLNDSSRIPQLQYGVFSTYSLSQYWLNIPHRNQDQDEDLRIGSPPFGKTSAPS